MLDLLQTFSRPFGAELKPEKWQDKQQVLLYSLRPKTSVAGLVQLCSNSATLILAQRE